MKRIREKIRFFIFHPLYPFILSILSLAVSKQPEEAA